MNRPSAQARGGIAGATGPVYQDRVVAWLSVLVLADTEVVPEWGLPAATTLEAVRAQTGQPIDDAAADVLDRITGDRGSVTVTAKRSLRRSDRENSDLAQVIDQCVRQYWHHRPGPLNRFIIVSRRLGGLVEALEPLQRNRELPEMDTFDSIARTESGKDILRSLRTHAERSWRAHRGGEPTDSELRALFRPVWFQALDPEEDGDDESSALFILRRSIVESPVDADAAWARLVEHASGLASRGSGAGRAALQSLLTDTPIQLQLPRSHRRSIEKLARSTAANLSSLGIHESIPIHAGDHHIQRALVQSVVDLIEDDSLLLTGDPGAGKTGVLVGAIEELRARGADVVLLAADSIMARDAPSLQAELGLDADLVGTLEAWPGTRVGVLAVDGLDALRGSAGESTLRRAIEAIGKSSGRWRVLVSVRSYDLRNSGLASVISGRSRDRIEQCVVGPLEDHDIATLESVAPGLFALATQHGPSLATLLRSPFNLQLAAELMYRSGAALAELSEIRSQLGLLDLYWTRRVVGTDGRGGAREVVLFAAANKMAETHRLTVPRSTIGALDAASLEEALSGGILIERIPRPDGQPLRDSLAFFHNVMFDYVTARALRGDEEALIARLAADPGLAILIRPSILLHFHHLWETRPVEEFWSFAARFVGDARVPAIAKILAGGVAAERARSIDDVAPLRARLTATNQSERDQAELLLRHIVSAVTASDDPKARLLGDDAGPWLTLMSAIPISSAGTAQAVAEFLRIATSDD